MESFYNKTVKYTQPRGFLSIRESIMRKKDKDVISQYFVYWKDYYNYKKGKNTTQAQTQTQTQLQLQKIETHLNYYFIEYIIFAGMAIIMFLRYNENHYKI